MKVALARQKPFAQEPLGPLQRAPLDEVLLVSDEHVFDVVRVIQEIHVLRPNLEIDYVAVLARRAHEEVNHVAAVGEETDGGPAPVRPRRTKLYGHARP